MYRWLQFWNNKLFTCTERQYLDKGRQTDGQADRQTHIHTDGERTSEWKNRRRNTDTQKIRHEHTETYIYIYMNAWRNEECGAFFLIRPVQLSNQPWVLSGVDFVFLIPAYWGQASPMPPHLLAHSARSMCSLKAWRTNMQTRRETDRKTDRQTDRHAQCIRTTRRKKAARKDA